MGLTNVSTGAKVLNNDINILRKNCDYVVAIAGNPNVRKIYNI